MSRTAPGVLPLDRVAGTTRPGRLPEDAVTRWATVGLVVLITAAALWLRTAGLVGWYGTLAIDEARLALAARGIVEHGVPVLPSGWVYTRGLLAAYLVAPSIAILGESDFAARLPSALAGTALVPVAYLLGREVAGRAGGVFVALYAMGHPALVVLSRQAWFYAPYVLLFVAALLFTVRAHRTGQWRDQLLAGGVAGLTLFAHELGVFLLVPLAAQVAARLWRERRTPRRWGAPLASLGIVGAALVLLWLLVTSLRASSLVGAYGELNEYFDPRVESANVRSYGGMLLDGFGLLLATALAGLVPAVRKRRLVPFLLWLALVPPFVHAAFVIPRTPQERYGLTLVVVLALLAAESARAWAGHLSRYVVGRRRPVLAVLVAAVAAITVARDVEAALDRRAPREGDGAGLRAVRALGLGPDDIVLTDVPTVVGWYVGGVDVWLSSGEYEKYATWDGDLLRDVHTGALLVRNRRELDWLLPRLRTGQPTWVLGSGRNYQWGDLVDNDLKRYLEQAAVERVRSGDSTRIWRIDLPRPS